MTNCNNRRLRKPGKMWFRCQILLGHFKYFWTISEPNLRYTFLFTSTESPPNTECLVKILTHRSELLWNNIYLSLSCDFSIEKPGKSLVQEKHKIRIFKGKAFPILITIGTILYSGMPYTMNFGLFPGFWSLFFRGVSCW